ncbi:hypothetical protein D3C71_1606970 [compost metagenome]
MRLFHQPFGIGLGQARQVDVQVDVQAETTRNLANANLRGDRGVRRQGFFLLPGHELQGTDEAGRVTGGEHLLGVGAVTASTAQFLGGAQADHQLSVAGTGLAIAPTGGGSFCDVQRSDLLHLEPR